MAVFRIEKTRDYTVMSNYHLRDMSLSLKAKGLLSLMVSPDGMGLGPGGVYPGDRGGGPAAAGKVLLLFLPQYAGGGDHRPAGALPGFVPACAGIGG